jgi:hypothetical protein
MAAESYPFDQVPTIIDNECFTAQVARQRDGSLVCHEGVGAFTELRVTESAVPAMSVVVSAGGGWVINDEGTCEGPYYAETCDPTTVVIDPNTSGSTRFDTIWLRVCDAQYSAQGSNGSIYYVPGGASSVVPSTAVVPSDDCSYYLLAIVSVTNGETAINGTPDDYGLTENDVTDTRMRYQLCSAGGWMERATGPVSQTDYVGATDAVTLTAKTSSNRRYRLSGYIFGQQITNAGVVTVKLLDDAGVEFAPSARLLTGESRAINEAAAGFCAVDFTGVSGAVRTYSLQVTSSASAFRVAQDGAWLTLEDIGPVAV